MMKRIAPFFCAAFLFEIAAALNLQAPVQFAFSPPVNLGPLVNSPAFDGGPSISPDGLSLNFTSDRPGGRAAATFG
jgi:hypothetical protein